MSFPLTPVLDSFDRPNANAAGFYWSESSGNPKIASNAYTIGITGSFTSMFHRNIFGPDCESYFTLSQFLGFPPGTIASFTLAARSNTTGTTGYGCRILGDTTNELRIIRLDTSATLVSQSITTPAAGDSWGFRVLGAELQAWSKPSGSYWRRVLTTGSTLFSSAGNLGLLLVGDFLDGITEFGGGGVFHASDDSPLGIAGWGAGW